MTEETYRRYVDLRADQIVNHVAERPTVGMWEGGAWLALGKNVDQFTEIIRRGLDNWTEEPNRRRLGGPFHILPCMALLSRWPDRLPEDAVEITKDFMTLGVHERGNTENHWLMYYTGHLLAAERWPEIERTWNGLPPAALAAEASRWILGMIDRTARFGHHEYDSPQYHIEHMVSFLLLADHAQDAHLRLQARQTLDLFVADMALEFFYGAWAGGHCREGYRENTWTRSGAVGILQYLYFGGEDFNPRYHTHGFGMIAATAQYRPPALFAEMAWDRSKPHVVRKTKAPRTIYRSVEQDAEPVRKYTYMSRSFALGSTQLGLTPNAGPIDLVSWDLTWNAPKNQGKIVCNHPYRHTGRFGAFLVGYPQNIGRLIATGKPYLQWADRLFGASPYERIAQSEGAAIVAYRIPADDEAPFVNLFLPKGIAWVERDGWLLGDMGSFYTGLYPIGPYAWHEIREANNASIMVVGEGDQIDGWLLRIETRMPGLILEAVEATDCASFDAFCDRRTALAPDLTGWSDSGRIAIETVSGRQLALDYDGPHRVNGQAIDYSAYPLYEAPGVHAALNTGRMTFRRGDQEAVLDFGVDTSAPLLPIRVIG